MGMGKRKTRATWLLLSVAMSVALVGALSTPACAVGEIGITVVHGGSDTSYDLMAALDLLYNTSPGCNLLASPQPLDDTCQADLPSTITTENYRHDRIVGRAPLGSSSGISQMCGVVGATPVDFARSSRVPRTGAGGSVEPCAGTKFVAYARDAITWECFSALANGCGADPTATPPIPAVTNLTQTQLQDIYVNCTVNDWGDIGGAPGRAIELWGIQDGSGTRATIDAFLGAPMSTCFPDQDPGTAGKQNDHLILENQNADIIVGGNQANALQMLAFSAWNYRIKQKAFRPDDGSRLGKINNVDPTVPTIKDGTFPLSRFIFNVYRNSASLAVKNYVGEKFGWICKRDPFHGVDPISGRNFHIAIDRTIQSQGFVPLQEGPIGGGVVGNSYCRLFLGTPL